MNPVAVDGVLGLFMLVPVVRRRAVAANQEVANLAVFDRVAALVGNQRFVAWHQLARTAGAYLSWAIADEDVQDFGAANAIEDLHVESLFPAPQDVRGQGFAGRDAEAHGGKIEALTGLGQREHRRVERGNAEEDGRAILLDTFEHVFCQRPARIVYSAGSDAKGEGEVIAQAIGEEKLAGGEGNTRLLNAENGFGVVFQAVGGIVLQVDAALGEAGAARTIQPVSAVIFARSGGLQRCGSFQHPLFKVVQVHRFLLAILCQADHHDMPQVFQFRQNLSHLLPPAGVGKEDARTAVVEHVDIVGGAQVRVERNSDGSYLYRSKEGSSELRRIQQQQGHALFQVNTQLKQAIAYAVGEFGHLRIGIGSSLVINSGFRASPLRDIAIQESGGDIELVRQDDAGDGRDGSRHSNTSFLLARLPGNCTVGGFYLQTQI